MFYEEDPGCVKQTPVTVEHSGGVEHTPITVENPNGAPQESRIDTGHDAGFRLTKEERDE